MRVYWSIVLLAFSCTVHSQNLVDYVNPFIGTANEANTNPGVVLPWGMASISPLNTYDTIIGRGSSSPYYFGREPLYGFSHLNLSGTGCSELGTFVFMPTTGNLKIIPEDYWTDYSSEEASPGYYKVNLDRYNIKTELTATIRTTISKYTFPKGKSNILINLGTSLTRQKGAVLKKVSEKEIEGFKITGGFCGMDNIQTVYFVAELSKEPISSGVWNDGKKIEDFKREMAGDNIGAYFTFDTKEGEEILVKVGISYVSIENARKNLRAEQPKFDFDQTKELAENRWETELSKILVNGRSKEDKINFYSALYHVLQHPNIFNDVNGDYISMEGSEVLNSGTLNRYTVFSLWDTYRNMHPFLSLVYPQQQSEMVKSMIGMYEESGWLPKWELAGRETYVMVGDPALPVIADTYLRGIRDFDIDLAYLGMKYNASLSSSLNPIRPGLSEMLNYGYIPEDHTSSQGIWGTVSTGLEYCIADWNLAQLAKDLGKEKDYETYYKRSMFYKNYFDSETGFMRPKLLDGSWDSPFYPKGEIRPNHSPKSVGFVEGNSWQYTFMVPHDIPGLIQLMGGKTDFVNKLTTCIEEEIFTMHNEPDMAYPYLFNYVPGEEWRTQKYVRDVITKNFNNSPSGLPGNDDCGTISAYLLYAMMGFYPTCPGDMNYQLASPIFDEVRIKLDTKYYSGKEFVIKAKHADKENWRVESKKLNNKPYEDHFINHSDITNGGELLFILSSSN